MKIIFLLLTVTLSIQTYAHEKGKKNDHHNNRHHKINLDISLIPYFKQDQKKCETPCTVTFDARKSKAIGKSKIKYFHFDFGDGEKITSRNPVVTHTYLTSPSGRKKYFKINLQLESEKGKVSLTKSSKVKVASSGVDANLPPMSDFSYLPNDPDVNEIILLKSLSSDDTGISSYEWFISDGRSFNGQTVGLHFTTPGVYTVIHRVTDLQGLSSESMLQVTVNSTDKVFKNGLVKNLEGININKFNPIDLQVRMTLNESLIQMTEDLDISVNDESLPLENISFEGHTVIMRFKATEGQNTIGISGINLEGQLTSYAVEFYSGSKLVNVQTINSTANGTLKVYPFEDASFKQEFKVQNGYIILENVPKKNIVLEAVSDFGSAARVLKGLEADIDIEMIPFSPVSLIENNDFATSLDGWDVQGGIPERSYKISQGQEFFDDFDLSVPTDESSHVIIQRSFNSNVTNSFVTFEYNYVSLTDNEYLVVTLLNKTSGLLKTEFMSGKNRKHDIRNVSPTAYTISVFSNEPTDIIHLTLERFSVEQNTLTPMLNRSMLSSLSSASGQGGIQAVKIDSRKKFFFEPYTRTFPVLKDDTYITFYNVNRKLFEKGMNFLSVGPHNTSTKYTTSLFDMPILKEYFIYLDVGHFEGDARLVIEQPSSGIYATSLEGQVINSDGYDFDFGNAISLKQFSFDYSEIAAFKNDSELTLRLIITNAEGTVYNEVYHDPLIPLTDYNAVRVYGNRDPQMDGEFWAQSHTVEALDNIFLIKNDFRGFAINDISMLNSGFFSGHPSGHRAGEKVDYFTDGMSKPGIINGVTQRVLTSKAITDIAYLLKRSNAWPSVESIILTFENLGVHSEENKIIRARCTTDNRLYKDIFIDKKSHVTHGHLNFKVNKTAPINTNSFGDFRPFFQQTLTSPRTFNFKVPLDGNPDMSFIWEIRNGGNLIEVIDESTLLQVPGNVVGASGALLERSPRQRSITYTFPDGGNEYEVNLVAVRSIDNENRCLEQAITLYPAYSIVQDDSESGDLDIYCENEWQTFRGRDIIDPISKGKRLSGAVVSDLVEFNAGRFYVTSNEASFCGKSVIKDNFPDFSGCPTGQSEELCASIVIKGPVDSFQSTLDATEGKILIVDGGRFNGAPVIPQDIPNRFFLEDEGVTLDNSYIKAKDGSIIFERSEIIDSKVEGAAIIQHSVVWNESQIKDKVLIQKSLVENSEIMDTSKILGAFVLALEGSFDKPQIVISGSSDIRGYLATFSKIVINNSQITYTSTLSGAGKYTNSYMEGMIHTDDVDPNTFDSVRIANIDNSFLLKDCTLAGRVHLLNESIVGNHPDYPSSYTCRLFDDVIIKDGVWIGNGTMVSGSPVIEGDKVFIIGSDILNEPIINSKIGGTGEVLLINNGFVTHNARVTGTPQIIDSSISKDSIVSENVTMLNSSSYGFSIKGNASLENSTVGRYDSSVNNFIEGDVRIIDSYVSGSNNTFKDNSLVVKSSTWGNTRMSDEAYLSNVIVTRPNLNPDTNPGYLSLSGTVSAQDCEFNFVGSFSTGYFSLGESGYCTHSGIVVPLVNRELSSISYDNNVDQNITYASTPSKSKLTDFKRDMGERKKKLLSKLVKNQKETKRKSLKNAYRALASSLDYKMEETTRSNTLRSANPVNLKKIQLEKEQIKHKYQKK